MTYQVKTDQRFDKQLAKLDKTTALRIVYWLKNNLDGVENPRAIGKPLTGKLKGQWRYRVGVYRIIAVINDGELLVLCLTVGHRRGVYK